MCEQAWSLPAEVDDMDVVLEQVDRQEEIAAGREAEGELRACAPGLVALGARGAQPPCACTPSQSADHLLLSDLRSSPLSWAADGSVALCAWPACWWP